MSEFLGIFKKLKTHLMNGVSYMIPVVVGSGILMALAMMFNGGLAEAPTEGFAGGLWTIGSTGMGLMVPVLSAYIAASIADRAGIAPGLIGGALSAAVGAGFLGGLVTGIFAGVVCYYLKKIPLPKSIQSLKSIFIVPIIGTFLTGALMVWVIGTPMAGIMNGLTNFLTSMNEGNKIILGLIVGCMIAFDMGGPVNKVAYGFMVATVGSGIYTFAGPCAAAICIPPIGMGIATFIARKKFTQEEKDAGVSAILMGCVGITEGAIPYAANDPIRVIPSLMVGSAVGSALAYAMNVENRAAWGGLITAPTSSPWYLYILCILVGSAVTALMVTLLKKPVKELEADSADDADLDIKFE